MMSYTASVMENASIGTIVLSVVAQPAETSPPLCSSVITYSSMPSMIRHFSIQPNGTIVVQEHLDFESQQYHMFNVVAQDGCSNQTMADVNITILNVNDSAPLCPYHIMYLSISESTPPSNTTLDLHCIDPDDPHSSTITYNIAMGNDEGTFDISSDGYLSILIQLDYESITQHWLLIHVTKTTYPSVITKVTVVVTVLASNEFPPVFSSSVELSYSVNESLPVGSVIANITAEDYDNGTDGVITYSLSTAQDCFTIDPVSGSLALLCALDREAKDVYYVTVLAKDNPINNSLQRSTNITAKLNVLDSNDNVPQFLQSVYVLNVLETVSNTVLLAVHCSDSDEGDNITYHIVHGNSLGHFSVDPPSGNLSVGSDLNYESQQFYHLKVQCSDGGNHPLSSTASVVVEVVNIDEYDPVIQHDGLYQVAEDTPVGTVVATVSATDMDTGLAGETVYSINRTNDDISCPEELFEIDPTSGSLYLLATLDKELVVPPVYQCPVIISNHLPDGRQASDVLRLSVNNVNDVAPVCDQHVIIVEIFEDFVVGNNVCSFTCHDADSPTLTYSIANPLIPFIVTHNSTHVNGVIIQLSSQLDYETQTYYSFEVVVSDIGMPPLTTTLTIHVNVKDVNEHTPVFAIVSDVVSIPEDTPVGTVLYTFSADDNDRHSNLHYTVIEGNDMVVLNEVTGLLYLATSLDHEAIEQLYLTVQAVDFGPINTLTATALLNVSISDINDNIPVFSSAVYFISLVETVIIGTSFDLPVCIDADDGVNSLLSCEISSTCSYAYSGSACVSPVNSSPFSFNFTTGEGVVTSMIDYEEAILYVFDILCTDHGTPQLSASAIINVNIVPVNEFTPSFDLPASYNITVAEDVVIGSSIAMVTAVDLDSGLDGELTYNVSSEHFAIDPNTGVLFVIRNLDREQEMNYTLTVIASDNSPSVSNSAQVNVNIIVDDVNDNAPHCEQNIVIITISKQHVTVRSPIIQLNCSDADHSSSLHYTILTGNEQGSFSVHSNGSVVISSLLNMPEYHLSILVTDSSTAPLSTVPLSTTVYCYIHVDEDNQPPVFDALQPYNISLPLSTLPGSLLLTATANDMDDVISYTIFPSNSFLNIDQWTGRIYLISSLQRGQTGSHMFTLIAMDTAELSSMFNLTVEIIDDNYYSVKFNQSLYFVSVTEDTAINSTLLTVYCTNNYGEHIDNIEYSLTESSSLFHITQSTGLLTITGRLDYELDDIHNVSIACVDPTAPSLYSTAVVMVTVIPINEHTPMLEFDTMEVSIMENNVVGQHILQVSATDQDQNSQLSYYLSENFSPFYLDPISGVLYLIQSLDYESQVSYNMSVIVMDETARSSAGTIIVHIMDVNDNTPYCQPSFLNILLPYHVIVGLSVAMLNCNDHDAAGINSQLQFSLLHNNSDVFNINESTGEIVVAHESNTSTNLYFLIILVSDRGTPALNSTVAVHISIQQSPNDSSITEYDEGKNNSLTVNFTHLTLEQVSHLITSARYICSHCVCVCSGKMEQRRSF